MAKVVQIEVQIRGIRGAVTDADSLKKAIKATNEELGKTEFGTQAYKRLQGQLGSLRGVQRQFRDDTRKAQQAFEAEAQSQSGSYRALNAQLVKLRNEFKDLSKEERNSDVGKNLIKSIAELDKELKDTDASIGNFQRSVGNYGEAILGASKKQAQLVAQLEETRAEFDKLPRSIRESEEAQKAFLEITEDLEGQIEQLGKVTGKTADDYKKGFLDNLGETEGVAGGAVRGVKALGASFKALLANPVVAVISLIVASLGALFGAFTKTERGAKLLSQASSIVSFAFAQLGKIANSVIDSISAFAKDPVKGLKDLGQAVVDNVINRFKGLIDVVTLSGRAIGQLVTGNFEALKQTAKETGVAITQALTGLNEGQQREFVSKTKELTEEIKTNAEAWVKLGEDVRKSVILQNAALSKQLEGLITQEQLLLSVADDATKSFAEREEAAEKARAASEARAAKELQIARNDLELINRQIEVRRLYQQETIDLVQEQLSAFQALSAAERDLTLTIRDNEKTRAELKQDRLERDLDILIDGFDNQKTINERILQDDRVTLDERQKLLEETERLANESFQRQIETIQKFTGVRVDANKLIAESDTIRLNEQIRSLGLSEIIEGRLLEVIRERRLAVQDLTEAEATLNEEAANVPIQAIEAARDLQIAALVELGGVAEELSADQELIEARANERILQERLSGERLNNAERAALELELAEQVTEIQRLEIDKRVDDEVAAIQARRDERLKALFAEENKEKVSAEQIAQIRLAAESEILQARLNLDQLSANDRLALEVELQQARVAANAAANAAINDGAKAVLDTVQQGVQSVDSLRNILEIGSQTRLNNETNAIRKRYDAELELAEGNDEEITRIELERDAALAEVQREAFERGKRLQVAQALISGAQGVLSVLAAVPGPLDIASLGIARILAIGFTIATTAAQVKNIQSTEFEGAHGLLIPELAEGGTVTMNTTAKGRSHAAGHIKTSFHGRPVRIENGEFVTKDEHGNVAVINKQSSRMHAGLLNRIARKRFRGKGAVLSAINTSFGGIPLGEDGLMVGPNLAPFYMPDRSAPTGPGQISVTLSSDQVNQIAQSVAQGAKAGTMQGVSEGSEAAQRKKERRNTLTERIQ